MLNFLCLVIMCSHAVKCLCVANEIYLPYVGVVPPEELDNQEHDVAEEQYQHKEDKFY